MMVVILQGGAGAQTGSSAQGGTLRSASDTNLVGLPRDQSGDVGLIAIGFVFGFVLAWLIGRQR